MAAVAPPSGAAASHPFTCNTCQVAFRSGELQRTHMQSDWHRYNLKRRVASLPPLTSEIFAEKVLANKASAAATAARASFEKTCPACSKTYYSENAYQNHVGSQKHKMQVYKLQARRHLADDVETGSMMSSTFSLGEPLETESTVSAADTTDLPAITQDLQQTHLGGAQPVRTPEAGLERVATRADDDEEMEDEDKAGDVVEVRLNECLFCNAPAEDLDSNLKHMSKQHGMFIPERDYLVDLPGLIGHLHEIIHDLHQCLTCRQIKHTVSGVQTHMRDRGHCMIPYSTEDEMLDIGEYYDFRSTYSDDEDDEDESDEEGLAGGVKLGAARKSKTFVQNEDGDEEVLVDDEDGWESDASSLSSVPTDEITAMPIDDHSHRYKTLDRHRHHSHNDPRPHRNSDGFHSHAHSTPRAVYYDEYELHLPSGRTAGHRSLNKYYRQNLHSRPSQTEQAARRLAIENGEISEDDQTTTPRNERDRGRQLIAREAREGGMIGVTDSKKREVRAVEKRTQKVEQRARNRYQAGNEKRNNHQKHFRDHLLQ